MKSLKVCAALLLWAACGEDNQYTSFVDTGELCVSGGSSKMEAGQTLSFHVSLDQCLSASCDTGRKASCRAELEGDRIVVSSKFEWMSSGGDCTRDCGMLAVTCDSPPLEAGEYTVHFGEAAVQTITVPGDLVSECID